MISIKNIFVSSALAFSAMSFGQGTFASSNYPQSYEIPSSNLKETVVEKILTPKEILDINLNAMMTDPVLRNADWGFVIYDPITKKVVSSYNENASLVPASTTKLLTTDAVLSLLGENFRWTTQLEYSGEIDENGILNGNLYIVGSGDPSLGTKKAGAASYDDIVSDFIGSVKNIGIKKINGDIILQTAVFKENKMETLPENITWLEHNNYYLPAGSTKDIKPEYERLIVKNNFGNDKKYFYISPYIKQMVYAEKFEGYPVLTRLPETPASLANKMKAAMAKTGLPVTGKVQSMQTENNPESRKIITAYHSPVLAEIVHYINQHSDNALSEAALKTVGFHRNGDGTLESGRMAVTEHLQNISFDTNGLNYADGSGLSRSNLVTPISQVKFLSSLMNQKYYKTYLESLPIAGQTGTLKRSFLTNGYGQIFAKTGTLNKVKTLAGYMKTNTGKILTFSLLINNYGGSVDQVKRKMEQILTPALNL